MTPLIGVTGMRLGYELCVVRCMFGRFEVEIEILDKILDIDMSNDLSVAGYCLMLITGELWWGGMRRVLVVTGEELVGRYRMNRRSPGDLLASC